MIIVEGAISVKAVLNSKYRKVNEVFINKDKKSADISYIKELAKRKNVIVSLVDGNRIDSLAKGKTHGGVLADVSERKMQTILSVLKKDTPFLVFLEGIEDSYNFGYIIRTMYALGCDGIILNDYQYNYDDTTLIKSSAGACELIPIVDSKNIGETISVLKENSVNIISAYRGKNPINMFNYDYRDKGIMVCIGGPLRGLSKIILDNSDCFVYIPYANDFHNALNASSAASILAAEIYRQREKGTDQ